MKPTVMPLYKVGPQRACTLGEVDLGYEVGTAVRCIPIRDDGNESIYCEIIGLAGTKFKGTHGPRINRVHLPRNCPLIEIPTLEQIFEASLKKNRPA